MTMIEPNFFIVGGMRCGTTSLWSYLRQHPEVYMPENKEPIFFCTSHKSRKKVKEFSEYLDLFSFAKKEKAIGEASAAYLTSPESAELIYMKYPSAKIIISIRNPVEQIYSVYQWMIREGWEWLSPFEKALEAEEERWNNIKFRESVLYQYVYFYSCFALYSKQIKRYLAVFPREKVKIILFDDLKINPIETVKDIYSFLEVDSKFTPEIDIFNKSNVPMSVYWHFILKNRLNVLSEKYFIPIYFQKIIKRFFLKINISIGGFFEKKITLENKVKLLNFYKEDIVETSKIINRNLDNWLILK